jgi:hypothetical protein
MGVESEKTLDSKLVVVLATIQRPLRKVTAAFKQKCSPGFYPREESESRASIQTPDKGQGAPNIG